jgi:hypothetical protein
LSKCWQSVVFVKLDTQYNEKMVTSDETNSRREESGLKSMVLNYYKPIASSSRRAAFASTSGMRVK